MYKRGHLKSRDTVVDGFENIGAAFAGIFRGENVGRMVVSLHGGAGAPFGAVYTVAELANTDNVPLDPKEEARRKKKAKEEEKRRNEYLQRHKDGV